jgi:hypothetical protein
MEGASHLYLDLQWLSAKAARKAGKLSLAKQIEGQLCIFVSKLPELLHLKNSEGESFVSAATQGWIEELLSSGANEGKAENKWELIESDAKKIAEEKSLKDGLAKVVEHSANNEIDRLWQKLIQAKLCLNFDRIDIALSLLEELEQTVTTHQLERWAPGLAIQVWRFYERAVANSLIPEEKKFDICNQLKSKLFSTMPELAAQWY